MDQGLRGINIEAGVCEIPRACDYLAAPIYFILGLSAYMLYWSVLLVQVHTCEVPRQSLGRRDE